MAWFDLLVADTLEGERRIVRAAGSDPVEVSESVSRFRGVVVFAWRESRGPGEVIQAGAVLEVAS